jgi:hypothetical protein
MAAESHYSGFPGKNFSKTIYAAMAMIIPLTGGIKKGTPPPGVRHPPVSQAVFPAFSESRYRDIPGSSSSRRRMAS